MKIQIILLIFYTLCISVLFGQEIPKPSVTSVNSVPFEGGFVTIFGDNLSNGIDKYMNNTMVLIGNSTCNVKYLDGKQIVCKVGPSSIKDNNITLPISISVNGINNEDNGVTFIYGIPYIRGYYYLNNTQNLTLFGNNFGNEENVKVCNGVTCESTTNVNHIFNDSIISFKYNESVSNKILVEANGKNVSLSDIKETSFMATYKYEDFNATSLSINGQDIQIEIHNISNKNINFTPLMTILDGTNQIISGQKVNDDPLNNLYSFKIPKGCGNKLATGSIGDQFVLSIISYEVPVISSCSIDNNHDSLICYGNFSKFGIYFNGGKISIDVSNVQVPNGDIIFNDRLFSFPLNDNVKYGADVHITLCNSKSEPYRLSSNSSNSFKNINNQGLLLILLLILYVIF